VGWAAAWAEWCWAERNPLAATTGPLGRAPVRVAAQAWWATLGARAPPTAQASITSQDHAEPNAARAHTAPKAVAAQAAAAEQVRARHRAERARAWAATATTRCRADWPGAGVGRA